MMYLRLLSWNLRQRRWRHLLNIVAMAMTVSVVLLFVAVMSDLLAVVRSGEAGPTRILVSPKLVKPDSDALPLGLYPMLAAIDGARTVQRYEFFTGESDSVSYRIVGEEDSGVELNQDRFPVTPDVFAAWKTDPLGAIAGIAVVEDLGLKVGATIELPTSAGPIQIKTVGISYGPQVGHRIVVHFKYAQEFLKTDTCNYRVLTEHKDYERVARAIVENTRNSSSPTQTVTTAQLTADSARRAGMLPALLGFLGLVLTFTTGLTLANSSAIAIRERRTETATLRVLGFRRGLIVRLLLGEAVLVGLLGGLLAVVAMSILARNGLQLTPGATKLLGPVRIGMVPIVIGLAVSIVIPFAGALPSARAAVRRPVVEALREKA